MSTQTESTTAVSELLCGRAYDESNIVYKVARASDLTESDLDVMASLYLQSYDREDPKEYFKGLDYFCRIFDNNILIGFVSASFRFLEAHNCYCYTPGSIILQRQYWGKSVATKAQFTHLLGHVCAIITSVVRGSGVRLFFVGGASGIKTYRFMMRFVPSAVPRHDAPHVPDDLKRIRDAWLRATFDETLVEGFGKDILFKRAQYTLTIPVAEQCDAETLLQPDVAWFIETVGGMDRVGILNLYTICDITHMIERGPSMSKL